MPPAQQGPPPLPSLALSLRSSGPLGPASRSPSPRAPLRAPSLAPLLPQRSLKPVPSSLPASGHRSHATGPSGPRALPRNTWLLPSRASPHASGVPSLPAPLPLPLPGLTRVSPPLSRGSRQAGASGTCPELARMEAPRPGLIRCPRVGRVPLGNEPPSHSQTPAGLGTPAGHPAPSLSPWRLSLPSRKGPSSPPLPS